MIQKTKTIPVVLIAIATIGAIGIAVGTSIQSVQACPPTSVSPMTPDMVNRKHMT